MAGVVEHALSGASFDHVALLHDHHVVCHGLDHVEVVGDQQHGHVPLPLFLAQQFEDLRLHCHVERGGRLVRDQQVRLIGQRHGNHHALALSAAELVGEGTRLPASVPQADVGKQLRHPFTCRTPVQTRVLHHDLRYLPIDPLDRVQAGLWLLKDHRDFVAADATQGAGLAMEQVLALPQHFAVRTVTCDGVGQQLQDRHSRNGLT